ncbi:hypothetical protein GW17_00021092 [Ensete ventricosum]|nr:hypothetical protein GW17_00021092 [Ensete ventricosum]
MEARLSWLYHIRVGPLKVVGKTRHMSASDDCLFTRRSCTQSESVESDDSMSGSCVVCSTPRYGVIDFSGTIDGALDRVSRGSYAVGQGWTGDECSRGPPWLIGVRWGSD